MRPLKGKPLKWGWNRVVLVHQLLGMWLWVRRMGFADGWWSLARKGPPRKLQTLFYDDGIWQWSKSAKNIYLHQKIIIFTKRNGFAFDTCSLNENFPNSKCWCADSSRLPNTSLPSSTVEVTLIFRLCLFYLSIKFCFVSACNVNFFDVVFIYIKPAAVDGLVWKFQLWSYLFWFVHISA